MGPAPSQPPPKQYNTFFSKNTKLNDSDENILRAVQELCEDAFKARTGLLAVGLRGVGKSALLNMMQTIIHGSRWPVAPSGQVASTITKDWNVYQLRRKDETKLDWTWTDTPGDMFQELRESYESQEMEHKAEELIIKPCVDKGIACLLFVLSAEALVDSEKAEGQLQVFGHLHQKALLHNVNVICVITKVDAVDPKIHDDVVTICQSETVDNMIGLVSTKVGVNRNQVFPVANFMREVDSAEAPRKSFLALRAICSALNAAMAAEQGRQADINALNE